MEQTVRILVVDDEPDIRNILRILLEAKGYAVLEANNGRTAVQVVRQNTLYTSKAFKNGMSARKKLEYAMSDAAKADRQRVVEAIENGATQEAAVAAFVSEERFDAWYAQLMDELNELAAQ